MSVGSAATSWRVPTISCFYGIVIQMFWDDHAPPHFHALRDEHEAVIEIRTLAVIRGGLSRRAMRLVSRWSVKHRAELLENWDRCVKKLVLKEIPPLE